MEYAGRRIRAGEAAVRTANAGDPRIQAAVSRTLNLHV
jgi:hypothetical protein